MQRNFKLKDVKDFILINYGYDWRGYHVLDNEAERTPRATDFDYDCFSAVVVLYKRDKRFVRLLECSEVKFEIQGENNLGLNELWQDFLAFKQNINAEVEN